MRIDGISQGQLNISNISDILSKLNVGDVVRAQVLDMVAEHLILNLFDGTTLTASSMSQLEVKRGDFIDFTVKSKNDKQLFLETVKNNKPNGINESQDKDIKKLLVSLDIKPEETTINVAKELKSQNIPINKDIIEKAVEGVLKFKNLTPDKAAFLSANNLQVNENHISKLNSLVENKISVSTDIKLLIEDIRSIDDSQLLQKLSSELPGLKETNTELKDIIVPKNQPAIDSNELNKSIKGFTDELKEMLKDVKADLKQPVDSLKLQQKVENLLQNEISSQKNLTFEKLLTNLKAELRSEGINLEKLPQPVQKAMDEIVNGLLERINQQTKKATTSLDSQQHKVDKAKDSIVKELESTFVKIDESISGKDIDAKKVYKDLLSMLDSIRDTLQQSANSSATKDMLSKIDNIESNIRFLNDINSYSSYVQIPLNMNNNNTTGELYILKRDSRRKKIDPENATMYISLNTENMGQVDSLISINKKNVSVNMRVEEQRVIDFLKENNRELYSRLQEKGYKLVDFKYRLLEGQANVLNVNSIVQKEIESSRLSIDYRI